ncbi:MAG: hypothetical protein K2L37_00950, partial [Lactobacillus sp.]|nr:hypothetical protein [Lactobacillus sp.]
MNSSTADVTTTDLLLSDYTTRTDGNVFDGKVLSSIFKKVAGDPNATYSTIEIAARNTEGKGTGDTMNSGRDATQIKSENGNKHVVITLGGMQWTVVALSTDQDRDPILTLYLTDVAYGETCQWNTWLPTDYTSGAYPAKMYSTSYVRAQLLNGIDAEGNKVQYSVDKDTLKDYTRKSELGNYKFGIFAYKNVTGSLVNYLVQPKNVPYQHAENYNAMHHNQWTNTYCYNESSRDKISMTNYGSVQDNEKYFDWVSDYIWLPSSTELGWGETGSVKGTGLWKATTEYAKDCVIASYDAWRRTAPNHNGTELVGCTNFSSNYVNYWGNMI